MQLRPLNEHDIPVIQNWVRTDQSETSVISHYANFANFANLVDYETRFFWVATADNGAPIGFFDYELNEDKSKGWIIFYITPFNREAKNGTRLMELAMGQEPVTSVPEIEAIAAEDNAAAIGLLGKFGFTASGTTEEGWTIMTKRNNG